MTTPDDGQGGDGQTETNNGTTQEQVQYLSPTDHLVRASMALRGVRPSVEELETVRANPDALPGVVDTYIESEAFGTTIRDMHNEGLELRTFVFWFPPVGELSDLSVMELNASVQESPLRLIEHVVMNDRPYSEILTADYTVANEVVATVWGMDYNGDGESWVETRWPDQGRVHAGVLSDSFLYMRHYTTPLNAQRRRANMVTKNFLCFDFLSIDINVDGNVDLSDPEAVKDAVKSPECASCHDSLDPLSALFWRHEFFIAPGEFTRYPVSFYQPDYERVYRPLFTDREPDYFGLPANDVRELGQHIVADGRFASCTVERFYGYLAQVEPEAIPSSEAQSLRDQFIDSNMNAKALAKAIVLSDAFRIAQVTTADGEERSFLQKARPRQWSRMMEDLVGFRWEVNLDLPLDFVGGGTYGRTDLMSDSFFGYEVLAGGSDDFTVTRMVHTLNPTISLVFDAFAQEAAGYVVERDFSGMSARPLLTVGNDTNEAAVRGELAQLHLKLFAEFVEPNSEEVDRSFDLFTAALGMSNDPVRAWKTVLTAMFQDSRLIYY
ncbi:MAG: hypothetical protein AAFX99_03590 [Myxococcota bacterium]